MDSDSDEWDPVKELRKQSTKRENPHRPNLPAAFSALETNKRLKLSLRKNHSSQTQSQTQNGNAAVIHSIQVCGLGKTADIGDNHRKWRSEALSSSSLSPTEEQETIELVVPPDWIAFNSKRSSLLSECCSGTTIVPSLNTSRPDSQGSFQSASTALEPKVVSRNKARKSLPASSATKLQLELLEKRGLITPKTKIIPVGPQADDFNPMEGSYPEAASPSLMEDTPDSFLSQREHARTSLLLRIEQRLPTPQQELTSSQRIVPGTRFCVDAFPERREGVSAFFLTHFHSKALASLGAWLDKPLYCSQVIAKCLKLLASHINSALIRPVEVNETIIVDDTQVTALDANSCPGSTMFLFKLKNGEVVLHTGMFRASRRMESLLQLLAQRISRLYLDTTYCYPGWNFPPTNQLLDFVKCVIKQQCKIHGSKIVFAIACKTLGHEDLILEAAAQLQGEVWAPPLKQSVLRCLSNDSITKLLTSSPRRARIHLVTLGDVHVKNLTEYLSELKPTYTHLLLFHPSGWHLENGFRHGENLSRCLRIRSYGNVKVCPVPYSTHSGYSDLRRFVRRLRPHHVIPTVYADSEKQKKRMTSLFENWL